MTTPKQKRLTLIRHGNAEAETDVRDFERPLTKKGLSEATEMAKRFLELGHVPDLILASAAVRTRETAESFAKVLGVAPRLLQLDDSLYLAEGEHILAVIRNGGPRVGHLMVIGHNPGISATAIALAPDVVNSDLPTCGALTMSVSCKAWNLIDRRCVREADLQVPSKKFFDFS